MTIVVSVCLNGPSFQRVPQKSDASSRVKTQSLCHGIYVNYLYSLFFWTFLLLCAFGWLVLSAPSSHKNGGYLWIWVFSCWLMSTQVLIRGRGMAKCYHVFPNRDSTLEQIRFSFPNAVRATCCKTDLNARPGWNGTNREPWTTVV